MNDWLSRFSEWLQQAWVYIPAILSFITAIGLPSLVQIAKIFASAKLYLTQTKTLLGKLNEVIKLYNNLVTMYEDTKELYVAVMEDEICFDSEIMSKTINVKLKDAYAKRIDTLNKRTDLLRSQQKISKLDEIKEEDLEMAKKSVKLKVKKDK